MKVSGDDAELRLEVENVPAALAEHEHGGRAVLMAQRTVVVREQADERRFAGAVGADDRGGLAGVNREREAGEDAPIALDDRRIPQLEDWFLHATRGAVVPWFP